ncbi:MAG: bifunctional folylpolyglutamate synthase/dihydrofolate synthase [Actinomycetota bacterium]|nr:bifunctional folylpolyglutamate synthase/dihydrofolate synthase [Actinomycetota bacterium]
MSGFDSSDAFVWRAEDHGSAPGEPGSAPGVVRFGSIADSLAWLDGHTNFEQTTPTRAQLPTLDRIRALCRLLGDPQRAYRVVHVTGTNGKGSTVAMIASLLAARGLRVGVYTSPNLHAVHERLVADGEPITDESLAEVLGTLRALEPQVTGRLTRFELLTAAAFAWFADIAVDVAVVEVGLGGRWDATNVVDPDVCVVTSISYDHVEVLGPTLTDIAAEKAGIVKPGAPLVLGATQPELAGVFSEAAAANLAPLWRAGEAFGCSRNLVAVGGRLVDLWGPHGRYEDVLVALHGSHQGHNAACALAAVEAFFGAPIPRPVVDQGFGALRVPGRLEVVGRSPLVVLDGAHNVAGAAALAQALVDDLPVTGRSVAVVGMLTQRDPSAMLEPLLASGVRQVVVCPAPSPRSMALSTLAAAARSLDMAVEEAATVEEAVDAARRSLGTDDRLVVMGSLYVVAAARAHLASRGDRLDAR